MSDTNPDPKTSIQVIERMMRLLDALAAHSDPVSLKELALRTELHPSTAHRILNDMVTCRLVDRSDPGTYRLGMRLLELGNLVKARLSVRDAALLPMRELHRLTGQTVNLSVRQGDEIVYIERAYSERSGMQVVRAIGGRAPLHLTSVGKLFLAADESTRVRAYADRPVGTHAEQHHGSRQARTRVVARAPAILGPRQRGTGTRRALYRCGHLRRYRQARRRPVAVGAG
jgi:IclR family KDG regulon transcriptional repressor